MAVPTFVDAQAGATDAGGAWAYTCQTPTTAGNLYIVQILQDGATLSAITSVVGTNIENVGGTDNVWTFVNNTAGEANVGSATAGLQFIFMGRSLNASAPTISGGNSTSEDLYIRSYQFADVSTGTTLATILENTTAGNVDNGVGTSVTVADTAVTTIGIDRLCLNFVAITDDASGLAAFAGETGGDWQLLVGIYEDSSGTDGTIAISGAWISSFGVGPDTDAGAFVLQGPGGASEALAQQFTTAGALTVGDVTFIANKTGSPTDNLVVEIQTDAAGLPSGTVVGSSPTVSSASLSTIASTPRVTVSASLSAATVYHLVFRRDGARDTSNYYGIFSSNDDVITGGRETEDSGVWTDTSATDFCFALQTASDLAGGTINGGTDTIVSLPWGVVGFALIGTTVTDTTPKRPIQTELQAVNRASVW